jgi:hypothetical protein
VSQPEEGLIPYRVAYSERVRQELVALVRQAPSRVLREQILGAAREIDARLHIYPQFGQPLRDLQMQGETLWIAVVPPLTVQYIIDDDQHAVFVVVPHRLLPGSIL